MCNLSADEMAQTTQAFLQLEQVCHSTELTPAEGIDADHLIDLVANRG